MGRGKSGMPGNGAVSSPESLAQKAFNESNGVKLGELKSELKWWRDAEKHHEELDEDQHYWVIDKDGTEHFYQPGTIPYAETGINLGKVAYISNSNGDGKYDSNGVTTMDEATQKMFSDSDMDTRYDEEISRLYKTAWGKTH